MSESNRANRRFKSVAALSFGLALLSIPTAGCSSPAREPLRIGVNVWPPYELLYLARERGFFKAEGVDVDLVDFSSYTGELRSYHQRNLDGMLATLNEIQVKDNFLDQPAVVLVVDYSYGGDAIVVSPAIAELKDLRGKRIAYEESALGSYVLERALKAAGLKPEDVTLVNCLPEEGEQDFLRGKADAVVTYEPVLSRLLKNGGRVAFSSRQMPGEIVDVLAMRRSVLDGRMGEVRGLVRAWFRAVQDLRDNPQDAAAIMARREGGDVEAFLRGLEASHIPDRRENMKLIGTSMTVGELHAIADRLGEFLLRRGLARNVSMGADVLHPFVLESL